MSTITAMSPEGLWLDIWWCFNKKGMPKHPDVPPSVRLFLKYGDTLIFRHDLWHGGPGYANDNYRLFAYFQSSDKEITILPRGQGETHPAMCDCGLACAVRMHHGCAVL